MSTSLDTTTVATRSWVDKAAGMPMKSKVKSTIMHRGSDLLVGYNVGEDYCGIGATSAPAHADVTRIVILLEA